MNTPLVILFATCRPIYRLIYWLAAEDLRVVHSQKNEPVQLSKNRIVKLIVKIVN